MMHLQNSVSEHRLLLRAQILKPLPMLFEKHRRLSDSTLVRKTNELAMIYFMHVFTPRHQELNPILSYRVIIIPPKPRLLRGSSLIVKIQSNMKNHWPVLPPQKSHRWGSCNTPRTAYLVKVISTSLTGTSKTVSRNGLVGARLRPAWAFAISEITDCLARDPLD
jgi:hypothetical protein